MLNHVKNIKSEYWKFCCLYGVIGTLVVMCLAHAITSYLHKNKADNEMLNN